MKYVSSFGCRRSEPYPKQVGFVLGTVRSGWLFCPHSLSNSGTIRPPLMEFSLSNFFKKEEKKNLEFLDQDSLSLSQDTRYLNLTSV